MGRSVCGAIHRDYVRISYPIHLRTNFHMEVDGVGEDRKRKQQLSKPEIRYWACPATD